jgi:hypothetical protein
MEAAARREDGMEVKVVAKWGQLNRVPWQSCAAGHRAVPQLSRDELILDRSHTWGSYPHFTTRTLVELQIYLGIEN